MAGQYSIIYYCLVTELISRCLLLPLLPLHFHQFKKCLQFLLPLL